MLNGLRTAVFPSMSTPERIKRLLLPEAIPPPRASPSPVVAVLSSMRVPVSLAYPLFSLYMPPPYPDR
ncbi:hypothetical protein Barb7_02824 [Bacteroidales bacterium Barb7]|nr:hypothetical protein Barb7_02824 [Bacteroidales bacterium Barb7]